MSSPTPPKQIIHRQPGKHISDTPPDHRCWEIAELRDALAAAHLGREAAERRLAAIEQEAGLAEEEIVNRFLARAINLPLADARHQLAAAVRERDELRAQLAEARKIIAELEAEEHERLYGKPKEQR